MATIRIMPCLDMKEGHVVKGIHFVDLKDAGDPVEYAALYQKEGTDELAMFDIAATVENRKTRLEWVKNVSSVITIPLTVGGRAVACARHARSRREPGFRPLAQEFMGSPRLF